MNRQTCQQCDISIIDVHQHTGKLNDGVQTLPQRDPRLERVEFLGSVRVGCGLHCNWCQLRLLNLWDPTGLQRPDQARSHQGTCQPLQSCNQDPSETVPGVQPKLQSSHLCPTTVSFNILFTCVGRLLDRLASLVLHADRADAILSVAAANRPDL
jgi:hypothetical protein